MINDDDLSPPDGIYRYRVSALKLKLDIGLKHKMLVLNSCGIVSGRSFDIYMYLFFSAGHSLKKTGFKNLEQSIYLCILWFLISITASNYQLYTFPNVALCL